MTRIECTDRWRKSNKERVNEYARNYYNSVVKNDPEAKAKRAEYHAKWQRENKEKVNAYKRKYREKKREINKTY